jgi:peroxiredoxin
MGKKGILAALILFLAMSGALQYKVRVNETPPGLAESVPAPNFGRNDTARRYIVMNQLKGQTVLLLFSSFDGAKGHEMVDGIKQWVEQRQQNGQWQRITVVAVNRGDYKDTIRIKDETKLPFTMVTDYEGELQTLYNVRKLPSLFVVDPKGVVRKFQEGYSPELISHLDVLVDKIVKEQKS